MRISVADAERIYDAATDRINHTVIHGTDGEHAFATDDYLRAERLLAEARHEEARARYEAALLAHGGDSYTEGQAVMAELAILDEVRSDR